MVANVRISGAQNFPYSESDIRVNYLNLNQIIAAANANLITPDVQGQGQFYSSDGGRTWGQTTLSLNSGDDFQSDPAVDWTSDGTAWTITIGFDSNQTHLRLRSFRSADGGAHWTYDADASGTQTATDKEAMWVDHSPTSPHHDNIYVIWHNNAPVFVNRRTGPSGSWQTPVQVSGAETTGTGIGGDIKTNSAGDVFAFWPDTGSQNLFVAKSTDGGGSFAAPVTIAQTFGSFQVAVPADNFRQCLIYIAGGAYRTASKDLVYAMWTDLSGEANCTSGAGPGSDVTSTCKTRIWFSRSTDGGAHWEAARMINNQASKNDQFFPRLVVDETNGQLVAVYYDTVGDAGRLRTDLWLQRSSDDGVNWGAAVKVTTAQTDETGNGADTPGAGFGFGDQYGDYIGFSGYAGTFFPSWTDRRNGAREEIWSAPITTPSCAFIVDRSTFGQDEVEAKLPNANFTPAYWVAVSGFTPNELGLTAANLGSPPLIPGVTASLDPSLTAAEAAAIQAMLSAAQFAPPVVPQDPSLPDWPQTFLFPFTIGFNGDGGFQAMAAGMPPVTSTLVTLSAALTVGSTTIGNSAQIELVTGEDPYFIDVDPNDPTQPTWLSFDLRFFKANQGQSRFGVPGIGDPSGAPGFITSIITNLNTPGANLNGDSFDGLTQDEDQSALEFQQQVNGQYVFNFALARVRLLGKSLTTAQAVRVFFRLFQAQTTVSNFDPNTTYRFASDGLTSGHKIALLGVQNDHNGNPEYVTIPCFAAPRVNLSAPADMGTQVDGANVQNIATNPGIEVDSYFGCWLDINQPDQKFLPLSPPAGDFDGPWNSIPLHSIQDAIVAAPHQCLIAEIRFDDTPIPLGTNSATSDKLAQRNIAWIDGPNPGLLASRRMPHPIQVRPTPVGAANPDELMILWGSTPASSEASLYLPALSAGEIVRLADRRYSIHQLRQVDAHTVICPTRGTTFVPLPSGTALAAGLLTIELPAGVRRGDAYTITVRQVTDAVGRRRPPPPPPPRIAAAPPADIAEGRETISWRRVLGAFQFRLAIRTKEELLLPEERLLAVLKWMALVMPKQRRWYPVLLRYIQYISGRVQGFGGNPGQIEPSPTGQVPGLYPPEPPRPIGEPEEISGKIEGIVYDHFGDFEGFILETETGHRHHFFSREGPMLALVRRAFAERTRVTVFPERHRREIPRRVVLRTGAPRLIRDPD